MKEAIKYLQEELKHYKQSFRESKKYREWQDVAQLSTIIQYLEDIIEELKEQK